jgi:hypothetical protein
MQKYVKKSAVVEAFQIPWHYRPVMPILVETKIGLYALDIGNWVTIDSDGEMMVYTDERFREKFVTFGDRDMSFLAAPDLVG